MNIDEIKKLYNSVGLHALRENEIVKLINAIIAERDALEARNIEQLNNCMAAIAKANEERDAALAQNAELVAQVEALGDKLSEVVALLDVDGMTAVQWLLDNCQDIEALLGFEPEQHLRDIQAEAGRAGYEIGFGDGWEASQDGAMISPDTYAQEAAEDYAERIRRGEK